jgi:hypothetical protein
VVITSFVSKSKRNFPIFGKTTLMKKIITTAVLFLGVQVSQAQLTQANHAPANGDTYINYQCDSTNITPGGSGANATWNYASVPTHSAILKNYSAVTSTNTAYPLANVFLSSTTGNSAYYASSASKLEYYGGNVNIGAVSAILNYSAPVISAKYPMSLNTTTTAVTGGTITFTQPISVTGSFNGNSLVIADATGTLILPGPVTYTDAIRVITTQTVYFTTFVASGTLTQVDYDYYGGGVKSPLFTISTASANTTAGAFTQTMVTRYKSAGTPVGVEENNQLFETVQVFPNPASTNVQFTSSTHEPISVSITDITGKQVLSGTQLNGNYSANLSGIERGIYFYTVCNQKGTLLRSGKLLVN